MFRLPQTPGLRKYPQGGSRSFDGFRKAHEGMGKEMAGESKRVQVASPHAAILVELKQQRQSLLGQAERRRDQRYHRVSLVEVETEAVTARTYQWRCCGRQADCRDRRMFWVPRNRSNTGGGQPEPDPPPAWVQPGKPG